MVINSSTVECQYTSCTKLLLGYVHINDNIMQILFWYLFVRRVVYTRIDYKVICNIKMNAWNCENLISIITSSALRGKNVNVDEFERRVEVIGSEVINIDLNFGPLIIQTVNIYLRFVKNVVEFSTSSIQWKFSNSVL